MYTENINFILFQILAIITVIVTYVYFKNRIGYNDEDKYYLPTKDLAAFRYSIAEYLIS